MPVYVNKFLNFVQHDFPRIIVGNIGGPDVMAQFKRMPISIWDGDLSRFPPKDVGGFYINQAVR